LVIGDSFAGGDPGAMGSLNSLDLLSSFRRWLFRAFT
jgi:hypothetical protein